MPVRVAVKGKRSYKIIGALDEKDEDVDYITGRGV